MSRFQRYRKFLANGLLFHKILQIMESMGILIEPYYFYQELFLPVPPPRLGATEFLELGIAHSEELARLNPNTDVRDAVREDFRRGRTCFALRHGGEIIATSWCDTLEIHFPPCRRALLENEAYLYHMETLYAYRGQDLAPYLRSKCHERLISSGRVLIYSYTDYFNRPAIRFKEKIGARVLFVGLYVRLFGMKGKNWVLTRKNDVARPTSPTKVPKTLF